MKATLLIFVAVALVGCASPDLDNPQTLKRILAEAQVGVEVKTGWRKIAHANGKVSSLSYFKDGELTWFKVRQYASLTKLISQ